MARCEDAPCCGCCPSSQEAYYDYREEIDLDPWADAMDGWGDEDVEWEDSYSDVEADADTLASAGYGTDEDYGYYGDDSDF